MTNTVNILERTLAQCGDSTNTLYTLGTTNGRESVYEPLVVRITDHKDDDNAEVADNTDLMALFLQRRHGEPLEKKDNVLIKNIHSMGNGVAGTFGVNTGVIDSVVITNGGRNISDYGTLTIDGDAGGGGDAVLVPTIVDGVLTAIAITSGGTGYTAGALVFTNPPPTDVSVLFPDFDYSTFE